MGGFGRAARKLEYVFIALLLLSAYAYFFPRWADWNQNSRLDVVLAIVDRGTLCIDEYYENTGDYALFNGHYYGEKAPGASFLGVPFYWLFKITLGKVLVDSSLPALASSPAVADTLQEGGRGLLADSLYFALAMYGVTFFTVALPSALLGMLFYHFLGYFSDSSGHRALLTVAYGLGTIAFPYAGSYYGHQIAAVLLFTTFWLLYRMKHREMSPRFLGVAGFLLGYSVIIEYPTVLVAIVLFFYAVSFLKDRRKALWMVIGGLPPVLVLALHNAIAFGKPWEFSYKYSELWVDYHHTGFFGTTYPRLNAMWGMTFSPYRGLFFLSPFLLLAAPALFYLYGLKKQRAELVVSLMIVASVFLFTSSSKMWFGGHSVGPRYLIPMLPFLIWPIIFILDHRGNQPWFRALVGILVVVSIAFVWIETIAGQSFPHYSPYPLFDYSWPKLVSGDIARNLGTVIGLSRWYSLLPLLMLMGVLTAAFVRLAGRSRRKAQVLTGETGS